MPRYAALTTPLLGAIFGIASTFLTPLPALAAKDLGGSSQIKGISPAAGPVVVPYKGTEVMFMGGMPLKEHLKAGAIYSSIKTGKGWSQPKIAFVKPGCVMPVLEDAVSLTGQPPSNEIVFTESGKAPHLHNGIPISDADVAKETTLLTWSVCELDKPEDHPLYPGIDGKVEASEVPFIAANASEMTRSYVVSEPAIVKAPGADQYYMFYAMRTKGTTQKVERNTRTGKGMVTKVEPQDEIGVAYGKPCAASLDDTGLCWQDLSAEAPLISGDEAKIEGGVSAVLLGSDVVLYYRTSEPVNRLVRTLVTPGSWKIKETTPLTFQEIHPIKKTWKTVPLHKQIGIGNIDVKPYGKGYMLISNDYTTRAIGRWKSEDGINFYRDPYDANAPIFSDLNHIISDPYLVPTSATGFTVYYASSGTKDVCASSKDCVSSIEMRRFEEEENPVMFKNYYFSEDYVKPDYDSVKPGEDAYTRSLKNRRR